MDSNTPLTEIPNKLRWQCRRGLLELDVVLGNFLEQKYLSLPPEKQADFVRLLEYTDQELLGWFFGQNATPVPEDLVGIVGLVVAG